MNFRHLFSCDTIERVRVRERLRTMPTNYQI